MRQAVLLLCASLALGLPTAHADGIGEVRLADARVGRYQVTVATSPSPLAVGTGIVTVLVQDSGRTPVLDAEVTVQATPRGDVGRPPVAAVIGQNSNRLLYQASILLDQVGTWDIGVSLHGRSGDGEVSFTADVSPAGGPSLGPLLWLIVPTLLILAGYGARWSRQRRVSGPPVVRS
ncbi:MAG: hypothetical protein U0556_03155 [Dehalococcoidia bacterium]